MTLPASEMAVRDWLRTVPEVVAAVGGDSRKIDVDYSGDPASTHLSMFRAGGAPERNFPMDTCFMDFDCWGRGRGAALTLSTVLMEAIRATRETQMNDSAYLHGGEVLSSSWLPDPTGQARYVVSAVLWVTAREAVA